MLNLEWSENIDELFLNYMFSLVWNDFGLFNFQRFIWDIEWLVNFKGKLYQIFYLHNCMSCMREERGLSNMRGKLYATHVGVSQMRAESKQWK